MISITAWSEPLPSTAAEMMVTIQRIPFPIVAVLLLSIWRVLLCLCVGWVSGPPLQDDDLFLGQPIRLVHQPLDLLVGGLDLALVELLVRSAGLRAQEQA